MITVPCCEQCREGWSKDDEYFRLAIVSHASIYNHPYVKKLNEVLLRSLRKPDKQGFSIMVNSSLRELEMKWRIQLISATRE